MRTTAILVTLLGLLTAFARPAQVEDPQITERVNALLHAYSSKDVPAVMSMLDPRAAMYGTATSEFYTTPSGIERLLQADYSRWTSSSFGDPRDVTVETSGDLQTIFFDTPFTAAYVDGQKRTFVIRFATVWRKEGGHWLLIQSMNAVAADNP